MKLISTPEIKRVINAARSAGVEVGPVDIYSDRVTIHPLGGEGVPRNAFDAWKKNHDRPTRHKA